MFGMNVHEDQNLNDVFPHNFLLKSNGQLFQMRNVRDIDFNMNEKNVITQFLFFNPSKIILILSII